jgi:hypothetical protein
MVLLCSTGWKKKQYHNAIYWFETVILDKKAMSRLCDSPHATL